MIWASGLEWKRMGFVLYDCLGEGDVVLTGVKQDQGFYGVEEEEIGAC